MKNHKIYVFLFLLLGAFFYWESVKRDTQETFSRPLVPITSSGAELPTFTLKDIEGRSVGLQDFKGKPILLNFWASWCPPCVEELPSLLELAEKMHQTSDLVFLAVSEDEGWDAVENIFEKIKKIYKGSWTARKNPLLLVLDPRGSVAASCGVSKFPETYFINRDFKVVEKFLGPQQWISSEMIKWLTEHL